MHELIAVSDDLKAQSTKTRNELISTFTKKPHLFSKKIVTTSFLQEGVSPVTDIQSDLQTSLTKEIAWVSGFAAKTIDSGLQIDMGNIQAKADLIIEEDDKEPVVLMKDVPAIYLLQLEKHLAHVHELAVAMPTLDPAKGFELDPATGKGIYKAREVRKEKTKKDKKVLELAKATDKFQAQVQVLDVDVVVGTIQEQEWSSLTTPAVKAEILARIDLLVRSVKKARSRANSIEIDVTGLKVGKKLLDFVFKPLE
jgi:hypothetical protein